MVNRFVRSLESAVSEARLQSYRRYNDDDLDMIVNYFHNIELSEALYPALQAFEIALRNTIHATLWQHFSTEFWFDQPGIVLSWQQRAVQDARRELARHAKPQTPGRIVAELRFGFWHSMLNRPFEARIWHANGARLLREAFPHIPRSLRTRQTVWDRCDQIRRLRNRVFHYEPVWNRADLLHEHAEILDALRWISPEMHDATTICDRFPDVYAMGRVALETATKRRLQLP